MPEIIPCTKNAPTALWTAIRWIESLLTLLAEGHEPVRPRRFLFWRKLVSCLIWSRRPAPLTRHGDHKPLTTDSFPARLFDVPKLEDLRQKFGLGVFECELLLLCAAVELDPALAELCATAQSGTDRPYPTLGLAFRMFHNLAERPADKPSWAVLAPNSPLQYWRLLEPIPTESNSLASAMLKIDRRILFYLLGIEGDSGNPIIAAPLSRLLMPLEAGPYMIREEIDGVDEDEDEDEVDDQYDDELILTELSRSQAIEAREIAKLWQSTCPNFVVHLLGHNSEAKQLVVRGALAAMNYAKDVEAMAYRLPLEEWPLGEDVALFARLWMREVQLDDRLHLFVDAPDLGTGDHQRNALLDQLLSRINERGMIVATREPRALEGRIVHLFDVDKPRPSEQKWRWVTQLEIEPAAAGMLTSRFHFNFPAIDALCEAAESADDSDSKVAEISLRGRHWTRPRLGALAERIEPRASRDDLILPPAEMLLIDQIADQVRHLSTVYDDWGVREKISRGLGLGVLFAGESGTGKTFAAEVLAASLDLDLYRIDLSAVVDKYIGETEKNLRRLFDAAEDGGGILLFDEADSLFGKRTEVKESNNHFANIQVNYLLQRVESFRGLAILTTNRKSAIDTAFLRRLRFVVDFPFPSQQERQRMWEKTLYSEYGEGPSVPVALALDDYQVLSRLSLTCGNIRTVAMNAMFRAAALGREVDLEVVKEAARMEFRKLGREAPSELQERPRRLKEVMP
jgi:hypothetical protein